MEQTIRRLTRLTGVAVITAVAFAEYAATIAWRRAPARSRHQSRWIQRQAIRLARQLGLRIDVRSRGTAAPLLVCNHVSYLDIIVLAAIQPVRFVAKSEVRHWPWFGWLARCAGTVFVDRQDQRALPTLNRQLADIIQQTGRVVLFPEGTSSDGQTVLPFRSSMLAVPAEENWPVQPVWLGYKLPDGDVTQAVCWWGNMTLMPHLWRLLGFREIRVTVRFGRPIRHGDRKELATQLHAAVCDLATLRRPCTNVTPAHRRPLVTV